LPGTTKIPVNGYKYRQDNRMPPKAERRINGIIYYKFTLLSNCLIEKML